MYRKIYILLFLSLMIFFKPATGKPEPKGSLDKEKWEEITRNIDYSEEEEESKTLSSDDLDSKTKVGSYSFSWQLFLYILLGIWLFVLLYYIIRKNLIKKALRQQKDKKFTVEDIEKNLQESDLDVFLRDALKEGNYRLATRIRFLMLIKLLSEKKLIEHKPDKTNRQYGNELRRAGLFDIFSKVSMVFEHVWYGNFAINQIVYGELHPLFEQAKSEILKVSSEPENKK